MPRPVLARQARVGGHRQETRSGLDSPLPDDDRPVVQRRARREDVHQEIVGDGGVDLDAGLDLVGERLLTLDHNQGAGGTHGQRRGGVHDVVQHLLGHLVVAQAQEGGPAEPGQRAPDRSLEQDDDGERGVEQHLPQHAVEGAQVQRTFRGGDAVRDDDEQDAEERLLGPRPLQEQPELVDQHGHQDDVEQIAPVEGVGRELREQRFHHVESGPGVRELPSVSVRRRDPAGPHRRAKRPAPPPGRRAPE